MTTLQKLKVIEKKKIIYNIHYCNAGVGFFFYDGPDAINSEWKRHLVTKRYYSTFTKAVDAEYKALSDRDREGRDD